MCIYIYIYILTHFLTSQPSLIKLDNENIGGHLTPLQWTQSSTWVWELRSWRHRVGQRGGDSQALEFESWRAEDTESVREVDTVEHLSVRVEELKTRRWSERWTQSSTWVWELRSWRHGEGQRGGHSREFVCETWGAKDTERVTEVDAVKHLNVGVEELKTPRRLERWTQSRTWVWELRSWRHREGRRDGHSRALEFESSEAEDTERVREVETISTWVWELSSWRHREGHRAGHSQALECEGWGVDIEKVRKVDTVFYIVASLSASDLHQLVTLFQGCC